MLLLSSMTFGESSIDTHLANLKLHIAVKGRYADKVRAAIEEGANVNAAPFKETPLFVAASQEPKENGEVLKIAETAIANLLLEAGADRFN